MRHAIATFGVLALAACQPPPPEDNTPTTTSPTGSTPTPTTSTSTTFPTDTTFGGPEDQEPDHWLIVTELGQITLTPAGGPYTGLSGTLTLTEIVDELDLDLGPDCTVTWALTGTEPLIPGTCAGCDAPLLVGFAETAGDRSTCQSPDLPPAPNEPDWRIAWNPADQMLYRNMNGTSVWVAWWPGVRAGDAIDIDYSVSWPIFVDEEM